MPPYKYIYYILSLTNNPIFNKKASRTSALSQYFVAHVTNDGWLSSQDQILAHYRDIFTSTITCNQTPFEERVTNIICGHFWLVAKIWPNLMTTPWSLPTWYSQ